MADTQAPRKTRSGIVPAASQKVPKPHGKKAQVPRDDETATATSAPATSAPATVNASTNATASATEKASPVPSGNKPPAQKAAPSKTNQAAQGTAGKKRKG